MLKKIRNYLVGLLGSLLIRIIAPTLRIRFTDESGLSSEPPTSNPVVFAFWHNRMFLMPYLYGRFLPGRQVACLVSASQDGEMIARVLDRFDMRAVRGSSSRRGKEAYRELTELLKEGCDVAVTPDGPRGPRYQSHVGVVGLAGLSSSRLLPVSYRIQWKIELPSWDRFMIPLPFSFCDLRIGKAIDVQANDDESLEKFRLELDKRMKELGDD